VAQGQLDSLALGAATGPQGAIYRKTDYKQPWFDGSKAAVYPVYHVLAGLAPASGHKRIESTSSAPSTVAAVSYATRGGRVLWLANLTSEAQKVKVAGFDGGARLHRLSDSNFQTLAMKPDFLASHSETVKRVTGVELGPYGVVRITAV
jgi:hypothetical protein